MNRVSGSGWLQRLEGHRGDREALVVEGRSIDYAVLTARSSATAERLQALGVEAGDLVAVLAAPSAAGVALIHAMFDRSFVMLPLNLRLTEREQREALARTHARFLIVAEGGDSALARRLSEAVGCGLIEFLAPDAALQQDVEWVSLRAPSDALSNRFADDRARRRMERAALVLQTSGTSGRPKAAVLSLENLIASARASAELLGSCEGDRWLLCLPLYHIGGLSILIRSALLGTSVVLHERFDAPRVASALEEDRITQVSFVATMLAGVMEVRGDRPAPGSLALVLLGGGPASQELLSRARRLEYPLAPTYGLTEAASQIATRPPAAPVADEGDLAAGLQPMPGVEIRIVDAEGAPVETGCDGEIEVRGPIVMSGYLDDPRATANAIHDGWLATGDVGRLDPKGRLRVLDRRADLIVSGGENVYPAEIESILTTHPEIEDAGVVGVPDEEFGARPLAFIVLRRGVSSAPTDLEAFCRARLARYKIPVEFIEVSELPRTASGKLLRRKLAR